MRWVQTQRLETDREGGYRKIRWGGASALCHRRHLTVSGVVRPSL